MAQHLPMEEREIIRQMRYARRKQVAIANRLGRSRSTISREPEELLAAASVETPRVDPTTERVSAQVVVSEKAFLSLAAPHASTERIISPARQTATPIYGSRPDATLLYELLSRPDRDRAWEELGERRNQEWLEQDTFPEMPRRGLQRVVSRDAERSA